MRKLVFILFLLATCVCFGQEVKVGESLPAWKEGELDIHFISTGRGECTFQIFPDGTTFLVDASGMVRIGSKVAKAPWKPNDSVTAGQAIVDYINHFSPAVSKGHIDYFLLTHHHGDHMGQVYNDMPLHESGRFRLSSLCEIGSLLVMDKILDRTYPDFSYPKEDKSAMMTNYEEFLNWTKENNKSKIEKWDVGSCRQVVPKHDKSYDFTIRNIAGNGYCWTGKGKKTYSFMPDKQVLDTLDSKSFPDGNCYSCAYILSYGKFDFFVGGDLQFAFAGDVKERVDYDAESPLIDVVHKVEVMEANHHGCHGANSAGLLSKLLPDVWLVGTSNETGSPNRKTTHRIVDIVPNCDIFSTYQSEANLKRLVEEIGQEALDRQFVGRYGHIVVRVAAGGDSYMIYTLEDSDEEYVVKSIHGPYMCTDF